MNSLLFPTFLASFLTGGSDEPSGIINSKPNILIIYVDDLGYGDIGVNGAKGVDTPNIDKLAKNGINFTDAHSSSATCTPSRYSLLSGSYAFRNNASVLPGDAPLLFDTSKRTMATLLQDAGYTTAVVGKWHLGLGSGKVNWNKEITPGPREIGFDYSFLIPATGDRVPCVFVENQKVVGLEKDDPIFVNYHEKLEGYPTGIDNPEMLKIKADYVHSKTIVNGISRIGYMSGGENALWVDEEFPFVLTERAKSFIKDNKEKPFFLFFSLHDIHVPRVIHQDFVGRSTMGPRGDAIVQVDWCTGELVDLLEELGLAENTLIIFSSDNGPVLDDGYEDRAVELLGNHKPAGPFRGAKYSAYEAGTRVPTISYWPGTIKPGTSSALISQVDLYASLASLTGQIINDSEAPDSKDLLNVWLGRSVHGRELMIEESITLGLRYKNWKYIQPYKRRIPKWLIDKKVETGLSPEPQLFNLDEDLDESNNLAKENPEKLKEMQQLLINIKEKSK